MTAGGFEHDASGRIVNQQRPGDPTLQKGLPGLEGGAGGGAQPMELAGEERGQWGEVGRHMDSSSILSA
jgi:hypothetical protein